jgi:hypothetical protein
MIQIFDVQRGVAKPADRRERGSDFAFTGMAPSATAPPK